MRNNWYDTGDMGYLDMEELPKMGSGKIDFRTITETARELTI